MTNRFRETMSVQGLHELSTNFGTMGWLTSSSTRPRRNSRALHMSAREYNAFVGRQFPAVAAGVKGIPPLVAFVTPVATQLEALHPQFASVDSLPFLGLPLTTIPWILLGLGATLIGLGFLVWRTGGRGPLWCAAMLGVAMLIAPLALSYPRKAADAAKVAAVGRVALSRQAATGAQTANRLIDNMVTEVNTQLLPAVAHRLHLSGAALDTAITTNYPAVAKGLAAWSSIKPGAVELVRRQVASVNDAAEMNGLDFTPLPWYIMGPGIALMLTGTAALAVRSTPEAAWNRVPRLGATGVRAL